MIDNIYAKLSQMNRKQRREFYKANRNNMTILSWDEMNKPIVKRQPLESYKDKTRVGYTRRQANH